MTSLGLEYARVLRTPHSERFLLKKQGQDCAAVDIHYLQNGRVDSTLIILDEDAIPESVIPDVLREIDEILLPHVSIEEHNLAFTVVVGRVLGAFTPQEDENH